MTAIYCARWVWPGSSMPIEDGAVAVANDLIAEVGTRSRLCQQFAAAAVVDLDEAILIPGLVNSHSHLELTAMRGLLDREERDFPAWLRRLTSLRLERMTPEDLYVSAAWGAVEAARAGITCLGDASSVAVQSLTAVRDVGLRGIIFQESFGPDSRLAQENPALLRSQVTELRSIETDLVRVGVSPHAPYTVSGLQLKMIAEFALAESLPVVTHAAESAAEQMLLESGAGPFAAGLAARGIDWTPPRMSSIQFLKNQGLLETRPLLAHCIRVNDADLETIAVTGASVAHCPKSNAKLGHGRAPLLRFLAKGLPVGLGTDSVASNNTCDLLEEARFAILLSRLEASGEGTVIDPAALLKLATLGGARALGLSSQIGELRKGLQADLTAVSLSGASLVPAYDPVSVLLFASTGRDVCLTVVAGREIYRAGQVTTVDVEDLRKRIRRLAIKLSE